MEVDLEEEEEDASSQNEEDAQAWSEGLHSVAMATSSSPQLCSLRMSERCLSWPSLPTSQEQGQQLG